MTSSSVSNPLLASMSSATHRPVVPSARPLAMFRSRSARMARRSRTVRSQVLPGSSAPVDLNNNTTANQNANVIARNILRPSNNNNSQILDRMAILKAITTANASTTSSEESQSSLACSSRIGSPNVSTTNRVSKFEKPTSLREARRLKQQKRQLGSSYDPAVEQEFIRLRETVPSIAGSNASDLTIINEAISLICDLESQLIRKLKCQLPMQAPLF